MSETSRYVSKNFIFDFLDGPLRTSSSAAALLSRLSDFCPIIISGRPKRIVRSPDQILACDRKISIFDYTVKSFVLQTWQMWQMNTCCNYLRGISLLMLVKIGPKHVHLSSR